MANTETCMIRVPYYYNIPWDAHEHNRPGLVQLNQSTYVVDTHPVLSVDAYSLDGCNLQLPYDFATQKTNRVFVKVNNFRNSTFDANDLLNVKLCWPATSPFSFRVDHQFLLTRDLYPESPTNQLDIYVEIKYRADFYAVRPVHESAVPVVLVISKLPNRWMPIPIELYDYVVYAIDLVVLAVSGLHLVQRYVGLI